MCGNLTAEMMMQSKTMKSYNEIIKKREKMREI